MLMPEKISIFHLSQEMNYQWKIVLLEQLIPTSFLQRNK